MVASEETRRGVVLMTARAEEAEGEVEEWGTRIGWVGTGWNGSLWMSCGAAASKCGAVACPVAKGWRAGILARVRVTRGSIATRRAQFRERPRIFPPPSPRSSPLQLRLKRPKMKRSLSRAPDCAHARDCRSGSWQRKGGMEPREKVDELRLLEAIAVFWKSVKAEGEGEEDTGHAFQANAQARAGEHALERGRQMEEGSGTDVGDTGAGGVGEKVETAVKKIWQGASGGLREVGEEEDACHSRERMRVCEALTPLPHEWEYWKAEAEEQEEPADISAEDTGDAFWDACETLTPLLCECGLRQTLVPCYVLQTRLRLRRGAPHHTPVSPPILGESIRLACNFSCQVFSTYFLALPSALSLSNIHK